MRLGAQVRPTNLFNGLRFRPLLIKGVAVCKRKRSIYRVLVSLSVVWSMTAIASTSIR